MGGVAAFIHPAAPPLGKRLLCCGAALDKSPLPHPQDDHKTAILTNKGGGSSRLSKMPWILGYLDLWMLARHWKVTCVNFATLSCCRCLVLLALSLRTKRVWPLICVAMSQAKRALDTWYERSEEAWRPQHVHRRFEPKGNLVLSNTGLWHGLDTKM